LPTRKRTGRRGHWLQRDEVLALWREHLRVTTILKKFQRNPTAIAKSNWRIIEQANSGKTMALHIDSGFPD
jgi:hypothetical protein